MGKIKIERINSQLLREISLVLGLLARDNCLHDVTVTAVHTNNDLSLAKVYYTSLSSSNDIQKSLDTASDYIRKEVAGRVSIRYMPKLKFIYDDSISYGQSIEAKIREIHDSI